MLPKIKTNKLNQVTRHVFPFVLLVVGIIVIAGVIAKVGNPKKIYQQNTLTPIPTPQSIPHTTYTSNNLGISFSYVPVLPNGIGQYFFTKEIGNKVYLYWVPGSSQPFSGSDNEFLQKIAPGSKYVEVFTKDPHQSLQNAIKQQFLTGYSASDCFVNSTHYGHPRQDESFQTAIISYHFIHNQSREQLNTLIKKCPSYVTAYGVSYFMVDPKHSNKLLYVSLGQDDIPSGLGGAWDETIQVLQ